jgi:hypothetical protein
MAFLKTTGFLMPKSTLAGIVLKGKPWFQNDFDLLNPETWEGLAFDPDGQFLGVENTGITAWASGVKRVHINNTGIIAPRTAAGIGLAFERSALPLNSGIYNTIIPYDIIIPANCSGSLFYNATNPSVTQKIYIKRNNSTFVTCTITTAGVATFVSNATTLLYGDIISFCFVERDDTWAGIAITLKGTRSLLL